MNAALRAPLCASVLLLCTLSCAIGAAAAQSQPAETARAAPAADSELAFWQSADRIGTAAAYRAYLDVFPSGRFATLARAALDKLDKPGAAPVAAAGAPAAGGPGLGSAQLDALGQLPEESGAVTLRPGEVYTGPGPVTVGWLGAKKQIVIPQGPWIALAATDHFSTHRTRVTLTTVYFGRFEQGRLRSLMRYTFNSRSAQDARNIWWDSVDQCLLQARNAPDASLLWDARRSTVRQCNLLNPRDDTALPGWSALTTALARIGLPPPGPPVQRARFMHYDHLANYLLAERSDYLPAADVSRLQRWAQAYAPLAMRGVDRSVEDAELAPNAGEPGRRSQLDE